MNISRPRHPISWAQGKEKARHQNWVPGLFSWLFGRYTFLAVGALVSLVVAFWLSFLSAFWKVLFVRARANRNVRATQITTGAKRAMARGALIERNINLNMGTRRMRTAAIKVRMSVQRVCRCLRMVS